MTLSPVGAGPRRASRPSRSMCRCSSMTSPAGIGAPENRSRSNGSAVAGSRGEAGRDR